MDEGSRAEEGRDGHNVSHNTDTMPIELYIKMTLLLGKPVKTNQVIFVTCAKYNREMLTYKP